MTTNSTDRQLGWVVLATVGVLVAVPVFGMGFGTMGTGPMGTGPMMDGTWDHGMWGASGGPSGWLLVVGVGMQLLFLAVLVGVGYLGYRALTGWDASTDPALDELRAAYARGELSDEEYERRRERLETGQ
ncbi:SHOCT domain-containing protein [Halobacteria archaeon HArc-gm2]|nr:SHOCT domain-containing protein [Halobacteria archaeon HArc-gm2]